VPCNNKVENERIIGSPVLQFFSIFEDPLQISIIFGTSLCNKCHKGKKLWEKTIRNHSFFISNSNKTQTSFTKFHPPLERFVNLKNLKIFNICDFCFRHSWYSC